MPLDGSEASVPTVGQPGSETAGAVVAPPTIPEGRTNPLSYAVSSVKSLFGSPDELTQEPGIQPLGSPVSDRPNLDATAAPAPEPTPTVFSPQPADQPASIVVPETAVPPAPEPTPAFGVDPITNSEPVAGASQASNLEALAGAASATAPAATNLERALDTPEYHTAGSEFYKRRGSEELAAALESAAEKPPFTEDDARQLNELMESFLANGGAVGPQPAQSESPVASTTSEPDAPAPSPEPGPAASPAPAAEENPMASHTSDALRAVNQGTPGNHGSSGSSFT